MKYLIVLTLALSGCVVIDAPPATSHTDSIHVCKIDFFDQSYRGESPNRGKARLDAIKQCQAHQHEMFCRDEDVKCTQYH